MHNGTKYAQCVSGRSDEVKGIELIKKIVPEVNDVIQKRYMILKFISYNEPVGRRVISSKLSLKERSVRDEVEILKKENLLTVNKIGMNITDKGQKILDELEDIYIYLRGIPKLEKELKNCLNIREVIIVPGNSSDIDTFIKEIGSTAFNVLKRELKDGDIVGITGGSTMAKVAEQGVWDKVTRDIIVTPARGGLGKDLNTQSNSIAAKLSDELGGGYRLLYIPDNLGKEALEHILKNKEIKESINLIENINILLFGIGRADTMAKRRNLTHEKTDLLLDGGSVAEAFGHFFNIKGEEIWEYETIGISLNKFKSLENLIGVAGGEEKAEAIISISSLNNNMILVTDESAAKKILKIRRNY